MPTKPGKKEAGGKPANQSVGDPSIGVSVEKEKVFNIDEGDANADWIKFVNGGKSRRLELAIHAKLAKEYGASSSSAADDGTLLEEGDGADAANSSAVDGKQG